MSEVDPSDEFIQEEKVSSVVSVNKQANNIATTDTQVDDDDDHQDESATLTSSTVETATTATAASTFATQSHKQNDEKQTEDPLTEKSKPTTSDKQPPSIPLEITTTPAPKLDYASIPSFDKFIDLVHDDHYLPLPVNWHIIVADVAGSTKLIESGRYRDVNTIGVACICAVRNALLKMAPTLRQRHYSQFGQEFPYVFGGDGATLVVAPHQHEAAIHALCAVQRLAQENYDMVLRVGSVTIEQLNQYQEQQQATAVIGSKKKKKTTKFKPLQVQVAKYQIAPGLDIALFRGGGLALADTVIKAGHGQYHYEDLFAQPEESSSEEEDDSSDEDDGSSEEESSDNDEEMVDPYLENSNTSPPDNPNYDYRIQPTVQPNSECNLDGLSCRWKKIPNKHGCVLALLVMHNEDVYSNDFTLKNDDAILDEPETEEDTKKKKKKKSKKKQGPKPSSTVLYKRVLDKLEEVLQPQNTLSSANPIHPDLAEYKTAPEMINDEQRLHKGKKSSFKFWTGRAPEIGLCHLLFRARKLQHAIIDAPAYVQGMRTHADHCKFDDMLRMVIDCTPAQARELESWLASQHEDGKHLFYGTQKSQHTLMTCFLEDTNEGNHIHFVDGDKGGYALAAKTLKMQLGSYALAKRNMANVRLPEKKSKKSTKRVGKTKSHATAMVGGS
mmetsp:Transcript_16047/g.44172  ORF Transcript_16047/g.44172 Transcript_16047/m.44172 type:complete len:670 (+) Transcript_16047:172-2181(+)